MLLCTLCSLILSLYCLCCGVGKELSSPNDFWEQSDLNNSLNWSVSRISKDIFKDQSSGIRMCDASDGVGFCRCILIKTKV